MHTSRPVLSRALGVLLALTLLAVPARADPPGFDTEARTAMLVDFDTGAVLFAKDPDVAVPPASMSKIMTMYVVFEAIKEGTLKLTDELPVSEKAWRMGGSKMFVKVDTRVAVEDLIRGVIVQSGNDACLVLAEGLAGSEEGFVERMNRRAPEIGLKDSRFANVTGWPHPDHRMSARDLAHLAKRMITEFPDLYRYYAEREFTYSNIAQQNRNPLLRRINGTDGLKTGHTEEAGYGLTASTRRDDRRLILVVTGLKSSANRARETERLMEWGFREFENRRVVAAGTAVDTATVWLGAARTVPLVAERDVLVTVPRRDRDDLRAVVAFDGPVPAPIRRGAPVGTLSVRVDDRTIAETRLLAGADVDRLGLFGRLVAAGAHLVGLGPDGN